MFNRYGEIKNIYKNYLILIKKGKKYVTIGVDKKILKILDIQDIKYLKSRCVNYLILDNLDIIEKYECENNRYDEYYIKCKLINIVNYINDRRYR